MTTPRKILHLDLDAFFCAVEEQRRPELVGKAFAVGGRPEERGVVASCSYPARRCAIGWLDRWRNPCVDHWRPPGALAMRAW